MINQKQLLSSFDPCKLLHCISNFFKVAFFTVLPKFEIISTHKRSIKPQIFITHDLWRGKDFLVIFKTPKESNGESTRALPKDNSVFRRPDPAIAPSLHQITYVDYKIAVAWIYVHPFPFLRPHLEAAYLVLVKDGYAAHVCVHA